MKQVEQEAQMKMKAVEEEHFRIMQMAQQQYRESKQGAMKDAEVSGTRGRSTGSQSRRKPSP